MHDHYETEVEGISGPRESVCLDRTQTCNLWIRKSDIQLTEIQGKSEALKNKILQF